jgi:hypothetical protein
MQTPPLRPPSIGFSGQAYVGLEVKGKPFSAQQQWEQIWSDKNTSTHRSAHIYRDSAGRTRIEWPVFPLSPAAWDPPIVVEILDPVAICQYTVDTQNHIAHRIKAMPFPENAATGELTPERAALLRSLFESHPPPPPPPPPPLPGSEAARSMEGHGESVGITAYPRGSKNVTEENLGTQRIEGVLAQGYRSTTLMPSRTGDDALTVPYVYESWFSPEIDELVLMKTSDPRTGQSIHKLIHIVVGEPDPALFRIPADCQIVDESGPFQIIYKR